ncbi:Uncharacterized protein FKW44_011625 [Caligus rogercresseyi]|uniref:Uncharacterized protein n=1 Tax=Caligus rogercresseyi TaxID=217165 RepID=A0A7T8HI93_CALRO|nr:Uncharacterized protein FKW44_011625 [Caligus rogercresseyi]
MDQSSGSSSSGGGGVFDVLKAAAALSAAAHQQQLQQRSSPSNVPSSPPHRKVLLPLLRLPILLAATCGLQWFADGKRRNSHVTTAARPLTVPPSSKDTFVFIQGSGLTSAISAPRDFPLHPPSTHIGESTVGKSLTSAASVESASRHPLIYITIK